jgi:hypothetical protein
MGPQPDMRAQYLGLLGLSTTNPEAPESSARAISKLMSTFKMPRSRPPPSFLGRYELDQHTPARLPFDRAIPFPFHCSLCPDDSRPVNQRPDCVARIRILVKYRNLWQSL